MKSHIRRPLLEPLLALDGIIERVQVEQVHSPNKQPVQVPFHRIGRHGPLVLIRTAAAQTLVAVAPDAPVTGRVGGTFAKRRIIAANPVAHLNHAPAEILTGDLKFFQHSDILAHLRMSGQRHAVGRAPCGEFAVIHLCHPVIDRIAELPREPLRHLPVGGAIPRERAAAGPAGRQMPLFFLRRLSRADQRHPDGGQVLHAAAFTQIIRKEPLRPGEHVFFMAAAQHIGLVREHGDDRVPEILPDRFIVPLMGQADERVHRVRIQQIRRCRRVRFEIILSLMDAPDRPAGNPFTKAEQVPFPRIWRLKTVRAVPQRDRPRRTQIHRPPAILRISRDRDHGDQGLFPGNLDSLPP